MHVGKCRKSDIAIDYITSICIYAVGLWFYPQMLHLQVFYPLDTYFHDIVNTKLFKTIFWHKYTDIDNLLKNPVKILQ